MEQSLEQKLLEVGSQILKLHLQFPEDEEFGKHARALVKERLDTVLKQHYLAKARKGVKTS